MPQNSLSHGSELKILFLNGNYRSGKMFKMESQKINTGYKIMLELYKTNPRHNLIQKVGGKR